MKWMRKSTFEGTIKREFFLPADPDKNYELFSGWFYRDFSRILASYMQKGTWDGFKQHLPVVRGIFRFS